MQEQCTQIIDIDGKPAKHVAATLFNCSTDAVLVCGGAGAGQTIDTDASLAILGQAAGDPYTEFLDKVWH